MPRPTVSSATHCSPNRSAPTTGPSPPGGTRTPSPHASTKPLITMRCTNCRKPSPASRPTAGRCPATTSRHPAPEVFAPVAGASSHRTQTTTPCRPTDNKSWSIYGAERSSGSEPVLTPLRTGRASVLWHAPHETGVSPWRRITSPSAARSGGPPAAASTTDFTSRK